MEILNIKNWLEIKKTAKFEFIGNHKIKRLQDSQEFKLRYMYDSVSGNSKVSIVYAYIDLIHVDISLTSTKKANSSIEFKKVPINHINVLKSQGKEFLAYYV